MPDDSKTNMPLGSPTSLPSRLEVEDIGLSLKSSEGQGLLLHLDNLSNLSESERQLVENNLRLLQESPAVTSIKLYSSDTPIKASPQKSASNLTGRGAISGGGSTDLLRSTGMSVEKILDQRNKTHGDFFMNGIVAQAIKDIMRKGESWEKLNEAQREALDLIAMKISRLVSGDPKHDDHWDDISGYAQLGKRHK